MGGEIYSGNWRDLLALAPGIDTGASPCDGAAQASPSPPPEATPASGFVFSRTDKNELRWIDVNDAGRMGSVWIDEDCAARLGGSPVRGNWEDLLALAPALDTVDYPCTATGIRGPAQPVSASGYVFSRTDKAEYRWIDRDEFGSMGNIWIDRECADSLGGASAEGNWRDLIAIAPGFDTLASPCY